MSIDLEDFFTTEVKIKCKKCKKHIEILTNKESMESIKLLKKSGCMCEECLNKEYTEQ